MLNIYLILYFGIGTKLDQDWIRAGSGLDQDWIRIGSALDQDWIRIGLG